MPAVDLSKVLEAAQALLTFLFSWIVLLGIAVIISGKLASKSVTLGFGDDAAFVINLGAFKISAKGDEVSLGFILFFLALGTVIMVGGQNAYEIFKFRAGLDIGHWNSVCVIASFMSVLVAVLGAAYYRLGANNTPIIDERERAAQLEKLQIHDDSNHGGK